jgi:hydroxymethylpyrimidine/phosphomethylpyrimidine kinase
MVLIRRGYFVEYLLEHPAVRSVWDEFVNHPFVMALGNGTLPVDSFKGYIVQDYLYLVRSLPYSHSYSQS